MKAQNVDRRLAEMAILAVSGVFWGHCDYFGPNLCIQLHKSAKTWIEQPSLLGHTECEGIVLVPNIIHDGEEGYLE